MALDERLTLKSGLPPIGAPDARVLILGSLPGDYSLSQRAYYAHPRNHFWALLAAICDEPIPRDAEGQRTLLQRHRVAVWDVLASAERAGSLDQAIRRPIANDIAGLLDTVPDVCAIAFNGQRAAQLFRRHVAATLTGDGSSYAQMILPSTSPAHTMALSEKTEIWRAAFAAAGLIRRSPAT